MIGLENRFRLVEILQLFFAFVPRQVEHPVDVIANHRGLGAHGRHHLELADFLFHPIPSVIGHILGLEQLVEFIDFTLGIVAISEFLLDRPHLLVEVVLLLRPLHLFLDAASDLTLHLEHLDLRLHTRVDFVQALDGIRTLQQGLPVFEFEIQVDDDAVRQLTGLINRPDRTEQFRRRFLVEFRVGLESRLHGADEAFGIGALDLGIGQLFDPHREIGRIALEGLDPRAGFSFDQNLHRTVGQSQQLDDASKGAHRVDVLGRGLFLPGLALGREHQLPGTRHGILEGLDGLGSADEKRHHHVGKDNDVPQRQQRNDPRLFARTARGALFFVAGETHPNFLPFESALRPIQLHA